MSEQKLTHRASTNMYSRHLYRCIWLILQLLIDIIELIYWLFVLVRAALLRSYDSSHGGLEKCEYETLDCCQKLLSKKPKHIAVIVGPAAKHVNEVLFQRLFNYALQVDISCISIFDTRRHSERGEYCDVNKIATPPHVENEIIDARHCLWSINQVNGGPLPQNGATLNKLNGCANANGKPHSNGCLLPHRTTINRKSLEIFQFTKEDNFSSISEVCRELFRKRHSTEISQLVGNRIELSKFIDAALTHRLFGSKNNNDNNNHIVEPEICIVFNAYLCTFGMLPWHTRFTEFFPFESGVEFDANTFADVLYRYSRCEQRWGK